ncbi:hypothetical protein SLE2022_115820 [Rubroshorea leprosula]
MRLLTHNMLSSNIKGVTNGFPLRIEAEKVVEKQVEINHDFRRNIFPKIKWKAFVDASRILGYVELPEEAPEPSVLESDHGKVPSRTLGAPYRGGRPVLPRD